MGNCGVVLDAVDIVSVVDCRDQKKTTRNFGVAGIVRLLAAKDYRNSLLLESQVVCLLWWTGCRVLWQVLSRAGLDFKSQLVKTC